MQEIVPKHELEEIISNTGLYFGDAARFAPNTGNHTAFVLVNLVTDVLYRALARELNGSRELVGAHDEPGPRRGDRAPLVEVRLEGALARPALGASAIVCITIGVTVERVMTDNGSAYRSHLFKSCIAQAGLRHIRTKPYTPRTNGKAERFIQTLVNDWAYGRLYANSTERTRPAAGSATPSSPPSCATGSAPGCWPTRR